jgi:hypothetical protein
MVTYWVLEEGLCPLVLVLVETLSIEPDILAPYILRRVDSFPVWCVGILCSHLHKNDPTSIDNRRSPKTILRVVLENHILLFLRIDCQFRLFNAI